MPRPQFTLRALLVAMLVVGAFLGGMALQKQLDKPLFHSKITVKGGDKIRERSETIVLRDETTWHRDFGGSKHNGEASIRAPDDRDKRVRRADRPLFTRSKAPIPSQQ